MRKPKKNKKNLKQVQKNNKKRRKPIKYKVIPSAHFAPSFTAEVLLHADNATSDPYAYRRKIAELAKKERDEIRQKKLDRSAELKKKRVEA